MSPSRPTATARRRPVCGARSSTRPTRRAALPEPHNRVMLDPVLKDSDGIPAPRIDYTIGENTAKMMEHGIAHAKEILAAAEASDICINSPILYGGWHLLGTARMGDDPARSVVNGWG